MSKIRLIMLVCLSGVLSFASHANTAIVIDEGDGFKQMTVEGSSLDSLSIQNSGSNGQSLNVFAFSTLNGVLEADIPSWLVDEIFLDHGFASWQDASDDDLNSAIPSIVVDIDEINSMTKNSGGLSPSGFCGGRWTNESSFHSQKLDQLFDASLSSTSNGNYSSSIAGTLNATGIAAIDFRYRLRRNKCNFDIPYRLDYQHTNINVKAAIERSTINYSGEASLAYEGDILSKQINLLKFTHSFWATLAEVSVTTQLNLNIGLEIQADAAAEFGGHFQIEGKVHFDYKCYLKECRKNTNTTDFYIDQANAPTISAEVNVIARPYVDLNAEADLELFWKSIDIADIKIGLVASLPVHLSAYSGNRCGDADSDGESEWIHGAMLDVNFESYMYLITEVLNKKYYSSINLNLPNHEYYRRKASEINQNDNAKVYYKNLYFKDLINSGSGILEPMINIPDVVSNTQAGAIISSRPCYPYESNLVYEINWGDGFIDKISMSKSGAYLKHDWPYLGDVNIAVRIITDEQGRNINSPWTYKTVNISPDGNSPFYPWLPAVITSAIL